MNQDVNSIIKTAERDMLKSVDSFKQEINKLRTSRAQSSLIEQVLVDCYGSKMPINQVASISVLDARTLLVTPWDKNMLPALEKALLAADLGLSTTPAANALRVSTPVLTAERRKELVRMLKSMTEMARVTTRNIRRDANHAFKELLKQKLISSDDEHRALEQVQQLTDKFVAMLEQLMAAKEEDLLTV